MRQSKRTLILDAAHRVIERDGMAAVTFESVASESGLSKGGLLYHFPSRESLLDAVHSHRAELWQSLLEEEAGCSANEASPEAKRRAYANVSASASRADLIMMLDAATDANLRAHWDRVQEMWAPTPTANASIDDVMSFVARLTSDGLWMYDSLAGMLDPGLRQRVTDYMIQAFRLD